MKIKVREPKLRPEQFRELDELARLVGDFIQYWGFKQIHGRIWAYLYLSSEALNTRQLVELLRVSNALVCNSVADLLRYEVILEAGKGRNGVLLYRANPEVGKVVAGVLRGREQPLLKRIDKSFKMAGKSGSLRQGTPISIDPVRMRLVGKWIERANFFLSLGIGLAGTDRDPFQHPETSFLPR